MKKILFFGDSLTAGYGLRNAHLESFPALIQGFINKNGMSYQVINAGISGDTSAGGLQRISQALQQEIEVFVLALGANDLLRGIPAESTYANLKAIIEQVIKKYPGVKLMLLGMELPMWIPGKRIADFRSIFKKLALTYQMAFVPFLLEGVAGVRHLNLPDQLHPLAEGYELIAKNVWNVLKDVISEAKKL
jgi:acyl-CoA thioesterase-1